MVLEQLKLGANPVDGDGDGVNDGGWGSRTRSASTDGGDDGVKTARLPRWTRQEILVLIQGKKVAESRVRRGRAVGMAFGSGQVEPKWASVSSYCKRHGVNRGPVQCRKRWSNLAGDFKKIKEWESQIKDETDSFWLMRNDMRRERKLPGFFDKEIYDILHGGPPAGFGEPALALALAPASTAAEPEEESEPVFDSGRNLADDNGLFSNFEQDDDEEAATVHPIADPVPISVSEKEYQPEQRKAQDQGMRSEKQPFPSSNPETGSTSQQQRKRKRPETDDGEEGTNGLEDRLIGILERNGKMLAGQLEVQNSSAQRDREQRTNHADGLVSVLNKLADALGRIADKL